MRCGLLLLKIGECGMPKGDRRQCNLFYKSACRCVKVVVSTSTIFFGIFTSSYLRVYCLCWFLEKYAIMINASHHAL